MRPEDIAFDRTALGGRGDVRVRWLGTAGFAIEHDGWIVLIDPYFTRASLSTCLTTRLAPDLGVIRRHVHGADAVICGHTHFDHALDVPAIARMTGARVFGSRSAVALCRGAGIAEDRIVDVQSATGLAETRAEVGPFELSFVPSAHSPLLVGRVPFPGDIADCDDIPARMQDYRCGAVFGVIVRVAGRTIYHAGSANVNDAVMPSARQCDLLLMCVAGWTTTPRLVDRMLHATSPGAVLLSHWDNFFSPLESARMLPAMRMPRLVDELTHKSKGTRVGTVPILGDICL